MSTQLPPVAIVGMSAIFPGSLTTGEFWSDILAGRNAGCRGQILVRTGHDLAEALVFLGSDVSVVSDLAEAAASGLHS